MKWGIFLRVEKPTSSKAFYEARGMTVRHDDADKFVDFEMAAGTFRLGLLPRHGLAKDLGIQDSGHGNGELALAHLNAGREEADVLFRTVGEVVGRVAARDGGSDGDSSWGGFFDPDGYTWKLNCCGGTDIAQPRPIGRAYPQYASKRPGLFLPGPEVRPQARKPSSGYGVMAALCWLATRGSPATEFTSAHRGAPLAEGYRKAAWNR